MRYSVGAKFPSELVEGGFVGWSMNHTAGPIDFRNVRSVLIKKRYKPLKKKRLTHAYNRWKENAVPFGWSIEQFQAWARGILIVNKPTKVFMQISGVSEFYINGDKRYHGDCYNYNTTSHLVHFEKGKHTIDVRLVHDVRVFGGGRTPPRCQFHVWIEEKEDDLLVYPEDCAVITSSMATKSRNKETSCELLMPDYLKDIGFAGSVGSVSIQNSGDEPMLVRSITLCIVDDRSLEGKNKKNGNEGGGLFVEYKTYLLPDHLVIVPGQIRPIGFQFQKEWGSLPPSSEILKFWVRITLVIRDNQNHINDEEEEEEEFTIRASTSVKCVDWIKSVFKYTFVDYDNTVQYGKISILN